MERTSLDRIDATVENGNCVISADRDTILAVVRYAIENGRSATFYMPKEHADAVNSWFWTAERRSELEVNAVTAEEKLKIERYLGIRIPEQSCSNRIECPVCGYFYGAFEFIQQGIRENGREPVETIMTMVNTAVVRVNPRAVAVCSKCGHPFREGRTVGDLFYPFGNYYQYAPQYGCCSNTTPPM
nr:hypothetical protein [Rhodococcus wratislaviensis]